jgi:hypothetical protein
MFKEDHTLQDKVKIRYFNMNFDPSKIKTKFFSSEVEDAFAVRDPELLLEE